MKQNANPPGGPVRALDGDVIPERPGQVHQARKGSGGPSEAHFRRSRVAIRVGLVFFLGLGQCRVGPYSLTRGGATRSFTRPRTSTWPSCTRSPRWLQEIQDDPTELSTTPVRTRGCWRLHGNFSESSSSQSSIRRPIQDPPEPVSEMIFLSTQSK